MSQYPPPPPPGQYPPSPGQYPPTGAYPPGGYSMAPVARSGNGMAVTSLVCGFLFCIPAITGLLAVLFGLVGFFRGKDPRRGRRGMAIAGIILGLLSLGVWSGIGYGAYWVYGFFVPTTGLIGTLGNNDITGARQYVTPSVTDADLASAQATFSTMGSYVSFHNFNGTKSVVNGVTTYTVTCKAIFAKGSSNATICFEKDAQGNIKVSQLKFQ
ncbi:MAG: DUF4190 domain-containing protein [Tepidisphaerales bacterium]